MDYIGKLGGKKTVERRAVLIALAVLTFVFQNTGGLFPSPFGIKAILLIPLTICIAMFEREFAGIFFGLLSGVMLDSFSSQSVVFNSLFFTVIGFTAGALITYLMRNNLLCATIMTAVASVFYSTLSFVVYSAFDPIENHFIFFLRYYLASAIFTVLMTPVYYIIVRAIFKEFKEN
ncbi:MAG: rod shape-determining protein MreD [Clostridia bacterium]|nr:rod shape-determining protein MreD [Clostridia bacterium]MBQ3128341.1 rod shape-determining protein MreD [Clostridia bacterium]